MDRRPQDITCFSTCRVSGPNRVCQCGKAFTSTRGFVKWCSNDCRKQYYSDHRAKVKGSWSAIRKAKNKTLGSHTKWEWSSKLKAMRYACFWCGKFLKRSEVTKEHLTPISRGGTDDISNVVPSCWPCNSRKGTKTAIEFAAVIGAFPQNDS
jgi:5-methylcytosine-specific restriction endonuclease McrA